ncbi:MAG TPA: nuclear transport factor 2 family protein [Thermotogota bacterium]|nr:nuclear transport factor 2 family protein [Thermotogota bacterium]
MNNRQIVEAFWKAFDSQDWEGAKTLLSEDFRAVWPCSSETFDREGFIRVNETYPGNWRTLLQRYEDSTEGGVSVVHIFQQGEPGLYATSFYRFSGGKITRIEEYFSEEGEPPEWRKELRVNLNLQ